MTKLKYLIARKQAKNGTVDYYWQCKPSVAKKYNIPCFISLGKDEKEALIKWQRLNSELESIKTYYQENGQLPVFKQEHEINEGTIEHISRLYFEDRKYLRLSEARKRHYKMLSRNLCSKILFEGQKQPLGNLKVSLIDRLFCKKLYENLLKSKSIKVSSEYIKVFSNLCQTALDYGYMQGENPCTKLIIEKNPPRHQVWTMEEFDTFCQKAKEKGYNGVLTAVSLAMYTAQRQTDILNLKWENIKNGYWELRQSKTGSRVSIPIMDKLKTILDNTPEVSDYIVIDEYDNKPYNNRIRLFLDRFDTIKKLSNINKELVFRDLRRTAILALDSAGCTPSEIASISGHTRNTINQMLEIYAPKNKEKAKSAIGKLKNK